MGGGVTKPSSAQLGEDNEVVQGKRIKVGDTLPSVILKGRLRIKPGDDITNCFVWKDVTTEDLFKGKRIVLFSIPGAFTPVCSCDHLPGFTAHYSDIRAMGIDDIYCISVNDAFVMRQWGIMQGLKEEADLEKTHSFPLNPGNFQEVKLIADGSARFTRAVGMSCNYVNVAGFGERSWRYSAVINDMKVEKLFVEEDGHVHDDNDADPLLVSDVMTMLQYLQASQPESAQNATFSNLSALPSDGCGCTPLPESTAITQATTNSASVASS